MHQKSNMHQAKTPNNKMRSMASSKIARKTVSSISRPRKESFTDSTSKQFIIKLLNLEDCDLSQQESEGIKILPHKTKVSIILGSDRSDSCKIKRSKTPMMEHPR